MKPRYASCLARSPWCAAGVAIALHFGAVLVLGHYRKPILWENGSIASYMLAGKGFSVDFAGPAAPTSWQAPGYPFLLWIFIGSLGDSALTFLLISLIQSVLTGLMPLPLYYLTREWYGDRAAAVAAWIAAFMPLYAWYSTRIHQPAIVMSLYPWILLGWVRTRDTRAPPIVAALTGAATGMAALFSPTLLAVFGLISLFLAVGALLRREIRSFSMIILAGGLTLLVITPWTIRNHNVHGRLVPIKDSFPKELWYGNNPDATGTPFLRGGATPIDLPEIWHEMYGKASEIQMMDAIAEKAWEYVRSDPAAFVRRTLTKILWFWTAVPRSLLRVTGEGEAVRFYWLHTGYWAAFLLAAALAVGWMKIRIPPLHAAALSAVILVYSAVYGLTIVGNARFRGEIEFIFIPLVSAFLAGVARGPFGGSQDRVRGAEAVTKSI